MVVSGLPDADDALDAPAGPEPPVEPEPPDALDDPALDPLAPELDAPPGE